MYDPGDPRYPTLEAARTQVDRIRTAREKLDAVWTPLRRILTTASALVGVPLAAGAGYLASQSAVDGAIAVSLGVLVGTPALTYTALRIVQGLRGKAR